MSKALPERPDLGQLKKQAKDLLDAVHSGKADALARLDPSHIAEEFALHDAQLMIARGYGFPSWAKLKLHVETRTQESAQLRLIEASVNGDEETAKLILAERPHLPNGNIHVAAALGDASSIARALDCEPASATAKGGPYAWDPLQYLCFGRCGSGDVERAAAARVLLSFGADPNSAHIAPHWPESPQTALYGATGVNNHPELARVLLAAGADPNDCESRYHAAENYHLSCLEVLREFGADFSGKDKVWGNTPLYFLLGLQPSAEGVARGIDWLLDNGADPNVPCVANEDTSLHRAITEGWDKRMIERLLDKGANPAQIRKDGRSAYGAAVAAGREDIAKLLLDRGAPEVATAVDRLLGACMRADREEAQACVAADPILPSRLAPADRRVVFAAAREGRASALALLSDCGVDLKTADDEGATPLHWAAWHGQAEAAKVLVAAGADLNRRDGRFEAPPLGWCDHGWENCRDPKGDYGKLAELLLDAGAEIPPQFHGVAPMRALLKRRGLLRR